MKNVPINYKSKKINNNKDLEKIPQRKFGEYLKATM